MSNIKKVTYYVSLRTTALFKENIVNETKLKMITENNAAYESLEVGTQDETQPGGPTNQWSGDFKEFVLLKNENQDIELKSK